MPTPGERAKKKKKKRTAKGSKEYYVRGKTAKHSCAVCAGQLHGVPHGKIMAKVGKMSKTEKRPSVPFGGMLCTKCRRVVAEEKAKLEAGTKKLEEVDFKIKKFLVATEAAK